MADVQIIGRKPTEDELRNYKPLGYDSIEKNFRRQRIDKEQEYVKNHEPYCARCADLDFADGWEKKKKELERKVGKDRVLDDTKVTFNYPDLNKYGLKERFELKTKTPIMRDVIVDGVKVPKLVGHHHEYVCKMRGCGIAVQVSLQDFTTEPKMLDEEKVRKTE